jgi:DNA-binding SARP family transcriptional activator/predicted ATPase
VAQIRILGPVEVWAGERRVELGGPRQIALLALLALQPGQPLSSDVLLGALWGEEGSGARKSLQMAISRLRRAFGELDEPDRPVLRTVGGGYALALGPEDLDATVFERLVADGVGALNAGRLEEARAMLARALALWRGPILAEVAYENCVQGEIRRLEELRLVATEERIQAELELGRHQDVIGPLRALCERHPDRERPAGQLMLALYRSGRQAEALDAFARIRAHLARELGLEPGPALVALQGEILGHAGSLAMPPGATAPVLPVSPTNLPAALPALIGRDDELARVRNALVDDRERLVTVTGRSGAGKTSLALVVATELLGEYPGGIWLVRLAPTVEAADVPAAIAAAVGAMTDAEGSLLDAVIARVRARGRTLLVLDNLEHVLAAGSVVAALIAALPSVQVLATSQAPLHIADELCLPLDTLDDLSALAVIERVAHRRSPAIFATGRSRPELLELVHLLDGLPLSLEVAAAQLAVLSPAQLVQRLRASPDVLRDDRADRPERQRSLRATVEWSLGLLDQAPRTMFARLGAFAGAVELEELEHVCGTGGLDVIGALSRLLEVALVRRVENGDGRIRFSLPEGLRQIATTLLHESGDEHAVRHAHANRQLQIAWPARTMFASRAAHDAATAATAERRAALTWARQHTPALGEALAASHGAIVGEQGLIREALDVLGPFLDSLPDDPEIAAVALTALGQAYFAAGEADASLRCFEQAFGLAPTPELRIMALICRGIMRGLAGDGAAALADSEEATRLAKGCNADTYAVALTFEAQAHLFIDDPAGGQAIFDRFAGQIARADRASHWRRFSCQGDIAAALGEYVEAFGFYVRSLEEADLHGHELQQVLDTIGISLAFARLGEDAAAVELWAMAVAQGAEMGGSSTPVLNDLELAELDGARARLGSTAAALTAQRGRDVAAGQRTARARALAYAVSEGLAVDGVADDALASGDGGAVSSAAD